MTSLVSLDWDGDRAVATVKCCYAVDTYKCSDDSWTAVVTSNCNPEVMLFEFSTQEEALAGARKWVETNAGLINNG